MAVAPIRFDPKRAIELVLYVANKLRYPTFHSVSKILYFADREHLSRYGSLLSGDSYVAMIACHEVLKIRTDAVISELVADMSRLKGHIHRAVLDDIAAAEPSRS